MTSSDDWASGWVRLSEARDWLDTIIAASAVAASDHVICLPDEHLEACTIEAFREIIGYGKVPVRAVRDDYEVSIIAVRDDGSIIPERVEKLLAAASHTIVYPSVDQIVAYFSSCADRTIFGPRSDLFTMARDHVCFSDVEVHLPALVKPLEAIGFSAGAPLDGATAPVEPGRLESVMASRPGPKGSEQGIARLAWEIALKILADNDQRPPRGYGRVIKLARLVNAELAQQGHRREDDSVRKAISPSLREWEKKYPDR
jgi:hypothetical protein